MAEFNCSAAIWRAFRSRPRNGPSTSSEMWLRQNGSIRLQRCHLACDLLSAPQRADHELGTAAATKW